MSKINFKIFLIILLSLILSITLSFFYVNLYDAYQLDQTSHIMLKEETYAHWFGAAMIIEQLKDGVSFFVAGGEHYTKPLMRRIIVLYSLITDHQIMRNSENLIALGGKISFLIYQSIFYYLSVYIFYTQISKIFNKITVNFIIIFLCIEPTLFQYHSSFWTESIYFSIQLLILSMMLNSRESNLKFIIMGVLVGLLFLQRSAGIFYIIIISLYYLFTAKEKKINKVIILFIFFLTICFTVGLHNLKRAGIFYVMPTEGNYSMYRYFAKGVLKDSKKYSSDSEVNKIETNKALDWVNDNIPGLEYLNDLDLSTPYMLGLKIKDEKKKVKFYKYLNKRAYQILLENPIITLKKIINGMIHFSVLNPFFVYYDYEHFKDYGSHIIGDFSFSEKSKELIPISIIYSLIIYIISFVGIVECFKKNPKVTLLLLSSILYYYVLLGWYGKTRLFVPNLIYIAIFFGNGLNILINKIKAKI